MIIIMCVYYFNGGGGGGGVWGKGRVNRDTKSVGVFHTVLGGGVRVSDHDGNAGPTTYTGRGAEEG